jgi:hypothetical protein
MEYSKFMRTDALLWAPGLGKFVLFLETGQQLTVCRSWYANSTDIKFFHNGEGEATFGDVTVFEGLYDAWPQRK